MDSVHLKIISYNGIIRAWYLYQLNSFHQAKFTQFCDQVSLFIMIQVTLTSLFHDF